MIRLKRSCNAILSWIPDFFIAYLRLSSKSKKPRNLLRGLYFIESVV
jgi:hypothetical protein